MITHKHNDDGTCQHYSDCAVHNMPAYPNEECSCGAISTFDEWWEHVTEEGRWCDSSARASALSAWEYQEIRMRRIQAEKGETPQPPTDSEGG